MHTLTRRTWLRQTTAMSAIAATSWTELVARAAIDPARKRSCIVLWMAGGPSQLDTFDPKPATTNGGPFQSIATSVPGIAISEHLPMVARQMENLAIIRSMQTKEGDHD